MRKRVLEIAMVAVLLALVVTAGWAAPYVPILLRDTQFDPKCAEPAAVQQARAALAAASTTTSAGTSSTTSATSGSTISSDRNYYVVQFQGPLRAAWKRQATDLGATLIDYVPRYAFSARMTASQAAQVAALPFVRWVGPFPTQWKYRKSLVANTQKSLTVMVKLFPGESFDRVAAYVRDNNLWYLGATTRPHPAVRLRVPAAAIPGLASLPEVAWVEEYQRPKLANDLGQRFLNVSNVSGLPGGIDVWHDFGLFGAGQIVGIADTGLDTGNPADLHPDFLDASGAPRLLQAFALGRAGDFSDSTEPPLAAGGHGTHVAGSVLGNGTQSGGNAAASSYTGSFAGMAPEADLVFQSVMDSAGGLGGLPLNYGQLFDQAFRAGARIHTNSWGGSYAFGEYTLWSFMVDDYMFRHPEMTIFYAAGNDGVDWDYNGVIDPNSIGQPATAKDCISVGATESYRPPFSGWGGAADYTWWWFGYDAEPIASDYTSDNPSGMAAFSSRGPCTDGRIKPDVAAPGTNVISCRSRGKYGDYSGVEELWGIYDSWYLYSGGTSMATPLTAGAATLVRQYYEDSSQRNFSEPTGSLIKATLIHGATDLAPGQYGTGTKREIQPRPDRSQGWGRPNIGATLHPEAIYPGARLVFHDYGMISDTGSVDVHPVVVTSTAAPLKITLCWTDAPAATFVYTTLVNDLDLNVVDPLGRTFHGNFGAAALNDRVNNVEYLEFPTPVLGTYYVQISGFNVPQGPQRYSLVVTAATVATTFSISGLVMDGAGNPVGGVAVTVEGIATDPGRRVTGSTRSDGTYEIRNLTPGRYRVTPSMTFRAFTPAERRLTITNSNVTGVDFTATVHVTYQVSGFVWGDLQQGVPDVRINVIQLDPTGQDIVAIFPAMTDASGHYEVSGLDPAPYLIEPEQIADFLILPLDREITLPSAESDRQNFFKSLVTYSLIDVYTLAPSAAPIPGVTVKLERWGSFGFEVAQVRQTNSQGFVRLGGQEKVGDQTLQILREGYYRLSVSKSGYLFQIRLRDPAVIEGYLPPFITLTSSGLGAPQSTHGAFYFWGGPLPEPYYAASGLVRTLWDRPVPDVTVEMRGQMTGRVFRTRTQLNGFFRQSGMPADLYDITVSKPGWVLTPIDPQTGFPNPDPLFTRVLKIGPPAHVPPISEYVLEEDPWLLGFEARDFSYQYPNARQDYWAMPVP